MPVTYWNPAAVLGPVLRAFQPALAKAAASAKANAPYRTGRLRRSVRVVKLGPTSGAIAATAPYAAAVEEGSRSHAIVPRAKRALAGRTLEHPVAGVQHPGTKAQHFVHAGAATFPAWYIAEARRRFH
jgi:hypothetical protein